MTNKTTAPATIADDFPALRIEALPNGNLRLTDPGYDEHAVVDVHPAHLRVMAERLGLVRELSASEADILRTERGRIAELGRENDRLKRNMLRLQGHALALQEDFADHPDWHRADLSHEMGAINNLVALFDMAVDDFKDDFDEFDPVTGAKVVKACADTPVTQGKPNANPGAFELRQAGSQARGEDPQISGVTPPKTGVATSPKAGVLPAAPEAITQGHGQSRKVTQATPADAAPLQELHPSSKCTPQQLDLEGAR